ncbi:hypothetical protein [Streptomyces sp. x-80]|uniref:hypothetical protein n=1 Tax=Streptomyces sp. x-80 TaxID=2789282 RepID=UPI00398125E3
MTENESGACPEEPTARPGAAYEARFARVAKRHKRSDDKKAPPAVCRPWTPAHSGCTGGW